MLGDYETGIEVATRDHFVRCYAFDMFCACLDSGRVMIVIAKLIDERCPETMLILEEARERGSARKEKAAAADAAGVRLLNMQVCCEAVRVIGRWARAELGVSP